MKKITSLFFFVIIGLQLLAQFDSTKLHYIGEKFGGGVIFYIDETGVHGLIAAPSDQGSGVQWGCKKKNIGTSDLTDGFNNTQKIVEICGNMTAAGLCKSLNLGGFKDWYLPSQDELKTMYNQRAKIPGIQSGNYCSSTEYVPWQNTKSDKIFDCMVVQFGREGRVIHYHKESPYFVRAIRKF